MTQDSTHGRDGHGQVPAAPASPLSDTTVDHGEVELLRRLRRDRPAPASTPNEQPAANRPGATTSGQEAPDRTVSEIELDALRRIRLGANAAPLSPPRREGASPRTDSSPPPPRTRAEARRRLAMQDEANRARDERRHADAASAPGARPPTPAPFVDIAAPPSSEIVTAEVMASSVAYVDDATREVPTITPVPLAAETARISVDARTPTTADVAKAESGTSRVRAVVFVLSVLVVVVTTFTTLTLTVVHNPPTHTPATPTAPATPSAPVPAASDEHGGAGASDHA